MTSIDVTITPRGIRMFENVDYYSYTKFAPGRIFSSPRIIAPQSTRVCRIGPEAIAPAKVREILPPAVMGSRHLQIIG